MTKALQKLQVTPREIEVWGLIAEGKTNKEIANMIFRSFKTVEKHRARLMIKIGARAAADITREAVRYGVIMIEVLK